MIISEELLSLFEAYTGPRPFVFCDQDGVLADFEQGMRDTFPMLDLSNAQKIYKFLKPHSSWVKLTNTNPHIFENLPVLPGATKLISYLTKLKDLNIIELRILTAYPSEWKDDSHMVEMSTHDKVKWATTHFPAIKPSDIIVCKREDKPVFGNKAFQKTGVRPILIDDMRLNIEEWQDKGFPGILYTNVNKAMAELRQYLALIATQNQLDILPHSLRRHE